MLLMTVDGPVRAHLAAALSGHMRRCRRDAIPVPPELSALLESLAAGTGQVRPALPAQRGQSHPVDALLLSYAGAAGRLGISARTVRRRVAEGRLPVVREGRRRLIRVTDLERYANREGT